MTETVKEKFALITNESHFIRVDESHPLNLWIGINKDGRKSLRFIGEFSPATITGTGIIEVKQFELDATKCLQFSLIDQESSELFYKFCDDIIESSRTGSNQAGGYRFLCTRYLKWRKMFVGRGEILSREKILGLTGELYFLDSYMIPRYDQTSSIKSWSAPDPTIKDFSINDTWYEIKTTGAKSETVKINSVQQLDSDKSGFLTIIKAEKMAPSFNGVTLNALVLKITKELSSPDDVDEFQTKLALAGYAYNEVYDAFVYDIKSMTIYAVDKDFPALRQASLTKAIQNIEYDLYISQIEKWRVNNDN